MRPRTRYLSHLSVVFDRGEHLGENHQMLVIPAAFFKVVLIRRSWPGLLVSLA